MGIGLTLFLMVSSAIDGDAWKWIWIALRHPVRIAAFEGC
jgi:hypothetical protein